MPLVHGKSKRSFEKNVKTEMDAHPGKENRAQNLAIAYAIKRRSSHKAMGGDAAMCEHGGRNYCNAGCYDGGGDVSAPTNGPALDPDKVKQFEKGFNSGGGSLSDAYDNAKKAFGFAEGGAVDSWTKREDNEKGINRNFGAHKGISRAGAMLRPHPSVEPNKELDESAAKLQHRKILKEMQSMPRPKLMAEGGEMKSKRERAMDAWHGMANGGEYKSYMPTKVSETGPEATNYVFQKGVHAPYSRRAVSDAVSNAPMTPERSEAKKESHKIKLSELKSMPKPKLMAEGGMLTHSGYQSHEKPEVDGDLEPEAHLHLELENEFASHPDSHDSSASHEEFNQEGAEDEGAGDMDSIHPMVRKIMMGRAEGYSKGGMVANEGSGESDAKPKMAKWKENEFDDLALRDDLEFDSTGANEGDEDDDAEQNHERSDIVSRILKSRAKRDRMEVPGEGSTYGRRK